MIRHLLGGGPNRRDVLTECCLTAVPSGSTLVKDVADMTCPDCRASLIARGICPNCESESLAWGTFPVVRSGVSPGRYEARDVTTEFHLGCEECSETLISGVHPDVVAAALTENGWRP